MYFFFRCDADPVALTKYVLALIKKDKAETELRDSMEQQMEVFLQENTAEFIDSLFKTLSDKEYLNGPPKIAKRINSDDEDDVQEGKPDSTTSTPANVGELSSELKETDVQKPRRVSEVCNYFVEVGNGAPLKSGTTPRRARVFFCNFYFRFR